MQCLCFDKAVHLRVELHSVNSNMFLKGFQTWKNQMAALESTSVHIWAHTGINIDEMYSASNSATWRQEKVLWRSLNAAPVFHMKNDPVLGGRQS